MSYIQEIDKLVVMEFQKEHAGKWVAIKGKKVVDMGSSLRALTKRAEKRSDKSNIRYSLVPKGCIAGICYGI